MAHSYRVGVLVGDGIGPEIVPATVEVLRAALDTEPSVALDLVHLAMGAAAIATHGQMVPTETVDGLRGCDGWIMGPHDSASYPPEHRDQGTPNRILRRAFALTANVRPARRLAGVPALTPDMDLLIVRENTQGFYSDRNLHAGHGELLITPDVATTIGVFTRPTIREVVELAFQFASARRNGLTVVHKANVLPRSTGMFLEVARELAPAFPDVVVDDVLVDAAAALLVRDPSRFDVMVTENLFGDVLSDLAAELCGSLGLGASLNAGPETAMAQASHGAAPDIAGRGTANPVGLITSTTLLLRWLGSRHDDAVLTRVAARIESALGSVLAGGVHTPDLGGRATTVDVTTAVAAAIGGGHSSRDPSSP